MLDSHLTKILIYYLDDSDKQIWNKAFSSNSSFELIFTFSSEELIFFVAQNIPDVVIICNGVESSNVFSLISQIRNISQIPVYYIADSLSPESAFIAGKSGITRIINKEDMIPSVLKHISSDIIPKEKKELDFSKESLLAEMLDASFLSVFIFDSNLEFIYFNKRGALWMDLGPDSIGKSLLDIYPGLLSTGRYDQYKNVLETGEPMRDYIVEYSGNIRRHILRRAFRFGSNLCIISSDVGNPEEYLDVGRDEAKFEDLVDMLPEIVFELDKEGKIVFLNITTSNILGYTLDDVTDDRFLSKLFAPSDIKTGVKKIKGLLNGTERPERFQLDLISKNGDLIPAEFHVKTHESNSTISGLRGIILDLREKISTERELRDSETRLSNALNQLNAITSGSPDIIIFLDDQLRTKYSNKNSSFFDASKDMDIPFYELFPEEQGNEIRIVLESVIKTGKQSSYDYVHEEDDQVIYYETIAQPQIEDGVITGVILSTRDMTERIEDERQRAQLERSLISERLKYEKLEEINQLKTSFIATATHEIRTPLTAISGYAEIIEEMLLDEDYEQIQDMFDVVRRNVDRMLHLVKELLDVQRIESDKLDLTMVDTSLQNVLKTLDGEMSPRLYENFQQLSIKNNVGDMALHIDETRIHQVFTNLVINASKFSKERQVITLDVSLENNMLKFSVIDNGIGMTKAEIEKLFEPFPDIEPTVPGKGTGLGLFISRNIIEAHGGSITVHSEGIGKGSTFTFTLPVSN